MIFRRKKPLSNFEMPRPEPTAPMIDDDPDLPPLRSMPRSIVGEGGLTRTTVTPLPSMPSAAPASPSAGAAPAVAKPLFPPRTAPDAPRRSEAGPAPRKPTGEPTAMPSEGKRLIVGRDICLSGQITACDNLVVEGSVEAALTDCRNIEIAGSGSFKGSAEVEHAEISGHFEGSLTVRERLVIRSTGHVMGTIRYGRLQIEEGGEVNGDVKSLGTAAATRPEGATLTAVEVPAIASE